MKRPDWAYIEGRDGVRRRACKGDVLQDGERWVIPMTFMDQELPARSSAHARGDNDADRTGANDGASATSRTKFCVDARGQLGGFRPGWVFPANNRDSELERKANEAYEDRRRRSSEAWRRNKGKRAPLTTRPSGRSRGGAYPVPRPGDGYEEGDDDAA